MKSSFFSAITANISRHFFTNLFLITRKVLFCYRIHREMFKGGSPESTAPTIEFNNSVINSSQSSLMKTRRAYKINGVLLGLTQIDKCATWHEHSVTTGVEHFNVVLGTVSQNSVKSDGGQFKVVFGTVLYKSVKSVIGTI